MYNLIQLYKLRQLVVWECIVVGPCAIIVKLNLPSNVCFIHKDFIFLYALNPFVEQL